MIIYLAGGMKDGWQDRVIPRLHPHVLLDPRSWNDERPEVYTARDLDAIRQCDLLLANMNSANPSGYGVSVEIGFAKALGKRIVFLDEIRGDWRSRYFGMHRCMADQVIYSVESLTSVIYG